MHRCVMLRCVTFHDVQNSMCCGAEAKGALLTARFARWVIACMNPVPRRSLGWTTATTDSRGSVCGAVANEWVARTVTILPNGTRRSDGNQLRSLQIGSVADGGLRLAWWLTTGWLHCYDAVVFGHGMRGRGTSRHTAALALWGNKGSGT